MASNIEWTCNSRCISSFQHVDLRAIETAKSLAKNHRIVKGKLSAGTFMIRPLAPDSIEWLKGLFILIEREEFLIDITYNADCSASEVVDGTGFEPVTPALTVRRSTVELRRNIGGSGRDRTSGSGIFNPQLYRLSYRAILVIVVGFEPTTNGLKVRYSAN